MSLFKMKCEFCQDDLDGAHWKLFFCATRKLIHFCSQCASDMARHLNKKNDDRSTLLGAIRANMVQTYHPITINSYNFPQTYKSVWQPNNFSNAYAYNIAAVE